MTTNSFSLEQARRAVRRAALVVSRVLIGALAIYGAWSLGVRYAEHLEEETWDEAVAVAGEAGEDGEDASSSPGASVTTEREALPKPPPRADASKRSSTSTGSPEPVPSPAQTATSDAEIELLGRRLLIPVKGAKRSELRDSFDDPRGNNRVHQAIDIPAPRNRPVIAAEEGTILQITDNRRGGKTIRQLGPEGRFVYYYAHLERYARGLAEGDQVRRGQVLGYVGNSGNANHTSPHLHFSITELDPGSTYRGSPVNPYTVLR